MNSIKLENYDGTNAYFGTEKYTILRFRKKIYAIPKDHDLLEIYLSNDESRKEAILDKYPIFLVTAEDLKTSEASASSIRLNKSWLERILMEGMQI